MKTSLLMLIVVTRGLLFAGDPAIGVVSKVILEVSRRSQGEDWAKASKGDALRPGDVIRTGDRSFAVLKFNDNSMVRVRENSEVSVMATQQDRALSKSVDVERGAVGFRVSKQNPGEEFRFSSPTSVASVRGTEGLFTAAPDADTLTVTLGKVMLSSRFSQQSAEITEGITGIAARDGSVLSRPATRQERRAAEEAVKTGEQPHRLKLHLRSRKGEDRELMIDYKE